MVIKFQKACAISKTAESGYDILGPGSLDVIPDMDLEVPAACCIALALAAGTSISIHVSLAGHPAWMDVDTHLRHASLNSSQLRRRALEAISLTLFTWRWIRRLLASPAARLHFGTTLAQSSRRTAIRHA